MNMDRHHRSAVSKIYPGDTIGARSCFFSPNTLEGKQKHEKEKKIPRLERFKKHIQ